MRHLVIDLDRLITSREGLFDGEPSADSPYRYTEEAMLDLEEAVQAAARLSAQSWSTPIPALAAWKALGGPFEEQFEWSKLRPHVEGFPRRPIWRRAVRSTFGWAWAAFVLVLTVLGVGYQVSGYDEDASLTDQLFLGMVAFAALGAFVLAMLTIGWGLQWYQRRRPPSAGKPGGRHAAR
ncbi:hypothetical protein GCM10023168_29530 [Fodinibacter luteus]|uniref:Uncharacterized protein n=1 Tax=Fodinibacter luteus TaxID=552064 RepID=A0ABP8KM84_9MICO